MSANDVSEYKIFCFYDKPGNKEMTKLHDWLLLPSVSFSPDPLFLGCQPEKSVSLEMNEYP